MPIQTLIISPWLLLRKMIISQLELRPPVAKGSATCSSHATEIFGNSKRRATTKWDGKNYFIWFEFLLLPIKTSDSQCELVLRTHFWAEILASSLCYPTLQSTDLVFLSSRLQLTLKKEVFDLHHILVCWRLNEKYKFFLSKYHRKMVIPRCLEFSRLQAAK